MCVILNMVGPLLARCLWQRIAGIYLGFAYLFARRSCDRQLVFSLALLARLAEVIAHVSSALLAFLAIEWVAGRDLYAVSE